jgi:hypothetical protein
VFQPHFLPRFSATVDYYNIKIDNYITSGVGTQAIGQLCFEGNVQQYCNAITRNGIGEIDSFRDGYVNSGGLKTAGIDFKASYTVPLGNALGTATKLVFGFDGTRLLKYDYTPVVGIDLVYHCAGAFGANAAFPPRNGVTRCARPWRPASSRSRACGATSARRTMMNPRLSMRPSTSPA